MDAILPDIHTSARHLCGTGLESSCFKDDLWGTPSAFLKDIRLSGDQTGLLCFLGKLVAELGMGDGNKRIGALA